MMRRNKITLLFFAALTLVTVACNRTPDGVLGKEDMARLLADIHRAEVVAETNTRTYNDSMKRVLRQSVYAKHGVSSEEVDSSLSWYGYHMERYIQVYDRTIEILESDMAKAREKASASNEASTIRMTFEGDSVDVWTGERFFRWNMRRPSQLITFSILLDNNAMKGDAYTLRQKLVATDAPVDVTMVAEYRDGTYEYISKSLNGEGWHDIRMTLDAKRDARAVYGTVSYRPRPNLNAYTDSISLVRTRTDGNASDPGRLSLKVFSPGRKPISMKMID